MRKIITFSGVYSGIQEPASDLGEMYRSRGNLVLAVFFFLLVLSFKIIFSFFFLRLLLFCLK